MNNTIAIIQTSRLYLRSFLPEDDVHLHAIYTDKDAPQHIGATARLSLEEVRSFIKHNNTPKKYGIGRWAVLRKEDEVFIGWCGLAYLPEDYYVEMDYRFFQKFQGYDYPTEAVGAMLNYGFSIVKLPQIYARLYQPGHSVSERVLTKCDMRFLKEEPCGDSVAVKIYAKDNPYMTVNTITARETYPVRHVLLRQGKPLSACAFEGDELAGTLHFGIFFKSALMGVVTLMERSHPAFMHKEQIQLRGMGVLPDFQKKGIGAFLIKKAEENLLKHNKRFIWMNARIVAVPFYKELGYKTFGNTFTIPGIGLHYVMVKYMTA